MPDAETTGIDRRVLLTGCTGQVGGELLRVLAPRCQVTAPSREQIDLSDSAGRFCCATQDDSLVASALDHQCCGLHCG